MAVWHIDGFDYTTGSASPGSTLYNADVAVDAGASRWGTNATHVSNLAYNWQSFARGPGGTRLVGAMAFKANGGSSASLFFGAYDSNPAGGAAAYIGTNGGNNITVTNWGYNGGIFGRAQTVIISADAGFPVANNQWHWLEFDLDWGVGTPTQRLWVDGNAIYNAAIHLGSSDSSSPAVWALDFGMYYAASQTVYMDDVICLNNTDDGTPGCLTYADMPLGLKQFTTLRPVSDTTAQFTHLSGASNFNMVDEADLDGNTTYNYYNAPASGIRDLFGYGDLSFLPLSILTVGVITAWQNAGGGTLQMKTLAKSGGTEALQSAHNLGAGYATQVDMFYNAPSGSPWTGATVNAANFGYQVV